MTELHRKYRPKTLDEVVGQPDAVKVLEKWIEKDKVPHAVLFTGPSGTGKTTLARIMAKHVGCNRKWDLREIDCANLGNVDTVRSMREKMSLKAMKGTARVYIIDEAHALRRDPQTVMLKMLEEPPPHVYFFLATTDPAKLLTTIKTRCSTVKTRLLSEKEIMDRVKYVAKAEKNKQDEVVVKKIAVIAEGSARRALVLLGQVIDLESEEDKLDALSKADAEKHGFDIAKAIFDIRSTYADVQTLLKQVEDEPETVRRIILSYATTILLGSGKMHKRAYDVIQIFRDNFFDAGSGKALLTACCFEAKQGTH